MFSMKRAALLIFLFYSGLLPFVPLRESFLEIMLPVTMIRLVWVTDVTTLLHKIINNYCAVSTMFNIL